MGLYGSIYVLPLYLAQIQGYNAMQIGEVIMWMGIPQLFLIPLVPKLMKLVSPRLLCAAGFGLFGLASFFSGCSTRTSPDRSSTRSSYCAPSASR